MVAAIEVRAGVFDADPGAAVYKKRVARRGAGKSGGFRSIVVCAHPGFTLFQYGYAKSDRDDVTPDQIAGFKALAKLLRTYSLEMAREAFVQLEVSSGN